MRHRRASAPINTNKHFVTRTALTVPAGTARIDIVVEGVAGVAATTADVQQGAVIKAVHLEYWISNIGVVGNVAQFIFTVEKFPSERANPTQAEMLNLGSYTNKKNILYTRQGAISTIADGQSSVPIINDWVLIPKGKQRFGLGDRLIVSFATVGQDYKVCGIFIYKEYT